MHKMIKERDEFMETKENVLEMRMKKSMMKADCMAAYEYVTSNEKGLLSCKLEEEGEDLLFYFNTMDKYPLSELGAEELEYKYRFLENFITMQDIWQNYVLPMEEKNIYFDNNFMPYFAFRDIKTSDDDSELSFFEEYQYLAAGILNKKYSYTQVKESGLEILRKDKEASFVMECENLEELYSIIKERADRLHESNREQKMLIDRKKFKIGRRIVAGIIGILVLLLIVTSYQTIVILPRNRAVIKASRAYTVENYVECIDYLKRIEPKQMDTYTKYILAVSYARSEALEKEELGNVLDKLSIYSNEIELEYWIAIGRSDFERAENVAKALSDDKLLIYAYMKELNYLEGNVTMDGEEKQNRMNELSNAITEIGKKYTEEDS